MNNIANTIEINATGVQLDDAVNKRHEHITQNTIFVDSKAPNGGNGSLGNPFNNLQQAVNIAPVNTNIRLEPGIYTVPNRLLTINNKDSITLVADDAKRQFKTVIDADLLITGTSKNIGFKNIEFNGNYSYSSTQSLCYMDNVVINGFVLLSSGGFHYYHGVFLNNLTVQGSTFLYIENSYCENNGVWTVNSINATMSVLSCLNAKFDHLNGNMLLDGVTNVLPDGNNIGILSTSNNGMLNISNLNMMQPNGQYARIEKSGTCPYLLGLLSYDPLISTLNGVAIGKSGIQVEQVFKDGRNLLEVLTDLQDKIPEPVELIEVADEQEGIIISAENPNNIYFWV